MVIDEVYNGVGFKKQNLIHEFFIFRFCTPIFCGFNVQLSRIYYQIFEYSIQFLPPLLIEHYVLMPPKTKRNKHLEHARRCISYKPKTNDRSASPKVTGEQMAVTHWCEPF